MKSLLFFLLFYFPYSVWHGQKWGGPWVFWTAILAFALLPVFDEILKFQPIQIAKQSSWTRVTSLIPIIYAPTQLVMLIWALIETQNQNSTLALAGLLVSTGVTTGAIGITVAHELIHKNNLLEKKMGELLLWQVTYLHFAIEHVRGHHTNVATLRDPASSRYNESVYAFLPRTIWGSLTSAWHIEAERLQRLKKPKISLSNHMLQYAALTLLGFVIVYLFFGILGLGFFIGQSIVAFTLLEMINYVEHYGLTRKTLPNGKPESVGPQHSWDSQNFLTNTLLLNLQLHADHHTHPTTPYCHLEHKKSPTLPFGYSGMILLSLVPPLFRKVMNPRVPKAQSFAN